MSLADKLYHKRLPDFEVYDRIEMTVIPRYKTSGLSGDEWRQSVRITFYFKGVEFKHVSFHDMRTAAAFLPSLLLSDEPVTKEWLALEEVTCDQPSCAQKPVGRFKLDRLTASNGEYLDPRDQLFNYYRKFCLAHVQRGDCSREDADDNYIPLDKAGTSDSQNAEESPSIFGGVIDLSGEIANG